MGLYFDSLQEDEKPIAAPQGYELIDVKGAAEQRIHVNHAPSLSRPGPIAQLEDRRIRIAKVLGSSPFGTRGLVAFRCRRSPVALYRSLVITNSSHSLEFEGQPSSIILNKVRRAISNAPRYVASIALNSPALSLALPCIISDRIL